MPMFYTPKPRQFHYNPRYYDPEKEKWDRIKKKYDYNDEAGTPETIDDVANADTDKELEYFESRVREMDSEDRNTESRLGLKDLFRKREMPQFRYKSRFTSTDAEDAAEAAKEQKKVAKPRTKVKIGRRYDFDDDQYMEPMPAGKVMLYALLVCALLFWIFS